ncbi:MAG: MmgE/PrpD family protein, partial [Methyloligellaceae bacterium]
DGIRNAFGIALSQAAGSMEFLYDGAWTKRSHVGQAAQNGLICAVMASEGYKGPEQAFEGRAGFLHGYAPNADPDKAVAGLGRRWETMRLAVKPYPSCRYSHAAIDGILALMKEHGLTADKVEEVEIGLPQIGWNIIGGPGDKTNPTSIVEGQFSMPFCAAVALREGGFAWDDYKKHLDDDKTRGLCRKVKTVVDERADAEFPANMSGVARIRTASGEFETLVVVPKGEPDNFLDDEEFRFKFDGLCAPYIGADGAERLAQSLLALEQANSVHAVLALAQGAGRA